jgi:integrase
MSLPTYPEIRPEVRYGGRSTDERDAMKGTMREQSKGKWELRVSTGKNPVTGKYGEVSRTFVGTKSAAGTELANLVADVSKGKHKPGAVGFSSATTVAQLIDLWLDDAAARLKPSAVRNYRVAAAFVVGKPAVAREVDPDGTVIVHPAKALPGTKLAKMQAAKAGPYDVDQCYAELTRQGLSIHQRVQVAKALSACFGQAVKWGWMDTRPTTRANNPVAPDTEAKALDRGAITELHAAAVKDPDLADMIAFTYANGLRRGIVCGARWGDFDFAKGLFIHGENHVVVDNVICVGSAKGVKPGAKSPVSFLSPDTVATLTALRDRQQVRCNGLGVAWDPNGYLLTVDGLGHEPRHPDKVGSKMTRLARKFGVSMSPHALRHSAGTHMFQAGVDPATVAAVLGHHDRGETAMRFYNHTDEAAGRRAVGFLSLDPADDVIDVEVVEDDDPPALAAG